MGDVEADESSGVEIQVIEVNGPRRRPPSRLTRLRRQLQCGRRGQREEFQRIMEVAHGIAEWDPAALPAFVKLVGRAAQARAMTELLRHAQDEGDCDYDSDEVLFSASAPLTADGRNFKTLKREVSYGHPLKLGVDIILPWPWSRERMMVSLSKLRPGGKWGKWRQDRNHCVELWLPLNVGWVIGGNHSIAAGIIHARCEVIPEIAYDISDVYDHVVCDGLDFRRAHDHSLIAPVSDLEMAAIFEVGRIMRDCGIGGHTE